MTNRAQKSRKWRLVVFVAVIGLSGLVVSYCIAKMSNSLNVINASKQVSAWSATAALNGGDNVEVVAGNGVVEYPIVVTNDSEVASDCRITVTNVPDGVEVKLAGDGINSDSPMSGTTDGDKIIFSNPSDSEALTLNYAQTKNYKIQFSAPLTTNAMLEQISVDVELIQKDPRV